MSLSRLRALLLACCCYIPLAWGNAQDIRSLLEDSQQLSISGRQIEAEALAREAVSRAEASSPPGGVREKLLATALRRLGISLRLQGRFSEAEAILRDALHGAERAEGYGSRAAIKVQIQLGLAIVGQGRYADADRELREAVRRAPEPKDAETQGTWLETRARLGQLQVLVGNYAEAESLLNSVLEKSAGADAGRWRQQVDMALALLRMRQGRVADAEKFARAAAEPASRVEGQRQTATAKAYNQLGKILLKLDRLDEAEIWLRRAVAIAESSSGQDDAVAAKPFRDLAQLLEKKGMAGEAEAMFDKAAADKSAGVEVSTHTLRAQAGFLSRQGRPEAAQPLYDRALDQADRLFALSRGLDEAARENQVAFLRPIYSEAVSNRVRLDMKQPGMGHDRAALVDVSRTQSRIFTEMLRAADVARLAGDDAFGKLRAQRNAVLQRLNELRHSFTMNARMDEAGKEALPAKPIDDPYVLARWRRAVAAIQRDIAQAESERDEVEAHLWREFPRYMELEEPRPVTVEALQQRWLRPDETLLAYFRLKHQLLVFLVSREEFRLVRVAVKMEEIDRLVAASRKPMEGGGLDLLAKLDPGVLNRLYDLLLKPVEDRLPAGRRLLVVGDGPLYTLPFEMLVAHWGEAEKKAFAAARAADLSEYGLLDYAGAKWRFSYLPSLAVLAIQRGEQPGNAGFTKSLIAFADPVFARGEATPNTATRSLLQELGGLRGGHVSIPRLPETADEVEAVAKILGGEHEIYLRDAAQEARVKHGDLAGARYLHFATHGLLGGEFAMLGGYAPPEDEPAEAGRTRTLAVVEDEETAPAAAPIKGQPALVLTLIGDLAGEDGLLTMSEVMGLKMNSDLVVLSACNTAGDRAETRNGEGFAGLTRAFMHAGARGLLVSHWNVESLATRDLITDFFRRRKAGTATPEALSAAQADLRASRDEVLHLSRSHPFFWAPFVHVGD
jgi:CHAT domain-containing protein/Tfp pilus assembly protein PilF